MNSETLIKASLLIVIPRPQAVGDLVKSVRCPTRFPPGMTRFQLFAPTREQLLIGYFRALLVLMALNALSCAKDHLRQQPRSLTATVLVTIDRDGRATSCQVTKPSRDHQFDQEVVAKCMGSEYQKPPPDLSHPKIEIEFSENEYYRRKSLP